MPPPGTSSRGGEPGNGWEFPDAVKLTQGQKKALKRARQVAAGINPNGHKKPVSTFNPIASNKPRKIRDPEDDGDSTDSVSDSAEDGEIAPTIASVLAWPSAPFDEGQTTDTSALGNSPETPISQLSSLVSHHETQLLSSAEYEAEIPIPTTPEDVRRMLVDSNLPESSSNLDESKIQLLNLDNTHHPDNPTK